MFIKRRWQSEYLQRCYNRDTQLVVVATANVMAKSLTVAYILWFCGGLCGLHHLYLGRYGQWFLWYSTFGGLVLGWLLEIRWIPDYVAQANRSAEYFRGFDQKQGRRVNEIQFGRWVLSYVTASLYEIVVIYALDPFHHPPGLMIARAIARALALHLCFSSEVKRTRLGLIVAASVIGEVITLGLGYNSNVLVSQIPYIITAATAYWNQKYHVSAKSDRHPAVIRWPFLMVCAIVWTVLFLTALYNHLDLPYASDATEKLKKMLSWDNIRERLLDFRDIMKASVGIDLSSVQWLPNTPE